MSSKDCRNARIDVLSWGYVEGDYWEPVILWQKAHGRDEMSGGEILKWEQVINETTYFDVIA